MESKVYNFLVEHSLIDPSSLIRYDETARDLSSAVFYRDPKSGIVLQKELKFTDQNYSENEYLESSFAIHGESISIQDKIDTVRRVNKFGADINNKNIIDFGCGYSGFLRSVGASASNFAGVELSMAQRNANCEAGVKTYSDMNEIGYEADYIFSFHSFHYLDDPFSFLFQASKKLSKVGKLVIEAPSSSDLLLNFSRFRAFTFHKELLILYNAEVLSNVLSLCGYEVISIKRTQRYSIDNHISWMTDGKPGGHMTHNNYTDIDRDMYNNLLIKAGFYDTLTVEAKYAR